MIDFTNDQMTISGIDNLNERSVEARKTDTALAMEICSKAILYAKNIGYEDGLAKAYINAGICLRLASDFESALENFGEALKIYKNIDIKGESRVLNSMANVYLNAGNFTDAIRYFDDSIFLLESIGDNEFEASVLSNRGLAHQQKGDYDSALRNYIQSLSLHISNKKPIPYYLYNNIGIIYLEIGNYEAALKYFFSALKSEENEGNIIEASYTTANIGRTFQYMGDFTNAITYLSEAAIIMKKFGDIQGVSQVYSNLGKTFSKMKRFRDALKYMQRSLKYYSGIKDKSSIAHTLCETGEVYFELNDYVNAKKYFNDCLAVAEEIDDEINETRSYFGMAKLYSRFLDIDNTMKYLNKAEDLAENRSSLKELCRIYDLGHVSYLSAGKTEEANNYLDKYQECLNKMMNLEEANNIKMFTAYNNFDVELETGNLKNSCETSTLISSKVA